MLLSAFIVKKPGRKQTAENGVQHKCFLKRTFLWWDKKSGIETKKKKRKKRNFLNVARTVTWGDTKNIWMSFFVISYAKEFYPENPKISEDASKISEEVSIISVSQSRAGYVSPKGTLSSQVLSLLKSENLGKVPSFTCTIHVIQIFHLSTWGIRRQIRRFSTRKLENWRSKN